MSIAIIDQPQKVSLNGNSVLFAVKLYPDGDETNVVVHVEVTTYKNGEVDKVGTVAAYPDTNNIVDLPIQSLLVSTDKPGFTYPEHFTNFMLLQPGLCIGYSIRAWVSYNDYNGAFVANDSEKTVNDLYFIAGGISLRHEAALADTNTDWWTEYQDKKEWLHTLPGEKTTTLQSVEKLFYIPTETKEETATIKAVITDGENVTETIAFNVLAYVGAELCVSARLIERIVDNGDIASYEITLGDGRTQAYVVDREARGETAHFLLTNRYKVVESLTCFGPMENALEFEKNIVEKRRPDRISGLDEIQYHTHEATGYKNRVLSGLINSPEWSRWVAELLSGGSKYIYTPTNIAPVVIKTVGAMFERDPNFKPYSIPIEWDYSQRGIYESVFNIPVQMLIPPYYNELAAFYYKIHFGEVLDKLGGESIDILASGWSLPTAHAVFNLSDPEYWDPAVLESEYYPTLSNIVTPDFFTPENLLKYATIKTHNLLYFRGFANGDSRKILPMPLYLIERTQEQTKIITAWLDWVMGLLTASGNIVVSLEGNYPVVKSKSN